MDDATIYADDTESAWDRGVEAIERSREPKKWIKPFPKTLEKLLALPEWKGSTVERRNGTLILRHPCGASMTLIADCFERFAEDKAQREQASAAYEAALTECKCGRRILPSAKRHQTPGGEWHRRYEAPGMTVHKSSI